MTKVDVAIDALEPDAHARDVRLYCYVMLGSFTDADDLVRELCRRPAQNAAGSVGLTVLRASLYRAATAACLDSIENDGRRVMHTGAHAISPADVPWLQPYPDHVVDGGAVRRETIDLGFLTVLQVLPPRQRAVAVMRDVMGWPAADVSSTLGVSVAAVNSALQRAHVTLLQHGRDTSFDWEFALHSARAERRMLDRYVDAYRRADTTEIAAMLADDCRCTMPPQPALFEGRAAVASFFDDAVGTAIGEFRLVSARANAGPAAAIYLRTWNDTEFRALAFDVLRFENGSLAEITTFEPRVFSLFGLPETL